MSSNTLLTQITTMSIRLKLAIMMISILLSFQPMVTTEGFQYMLMSMEILISVEVLLQVSRLHLWPCFVFLLHAAVVDARGEERLSFSKTKQENLKLSN